MTTFASSSSTTAMITEPLLLPPSSSLKPSQQQQRTAMAMAIIFGILGSIVAFLSQWFLSTYMLDDDMMFVDDDSTSSSLIQIIWFSFQWSMYTCLIVFVVLWLLIRILVLTSFCWTLKEEEENDVLLYEYYEDDDDEYVDDDDDDDCIWYLELHYVIGSLLSILVDWLLLPVVTTTTTGTIIISTVAAVIIIALFIYVGAFATILQYYCFFRHHKNNNNKVEAEKETVEDSNSTSNTNNVMIICPKSSIFGLVVGCGSQFVLAKLLWTTSSTTMIHNVIGFSLLWSGMTVLLTFIGCYYVVLTTTQQKGEDNHLQLQSQQNQLRMEANYIGGSLFGICGGWILLDAYWLHNVNQILPSIGLLGISLLAFMAILHYFPEQTCLSDDLLEDDEFDLDLVDDGTKKKMTSEDDEVMMIV